MGSDTRVEYPDIDDILGGPTSSSPPPPPPPRPAEPRKFTVPKASKHPKARNIQPIDEKKANLVAELEEIFQQIDVLLTEPEEDIVPATDLSDDVKSVLSPYLEKYRSEFGWPMLTANVKNVAK